MTIPDIRSLAPMRINTTVIPVAGLQVPPEVASEAFRHSGNEYASALVVPGAAPRARWRMPAKTAYDLIGLKFLKATALDLHFAKFVDGIRDSNSTHTKFGLAASAQAMVYIQRFSVADRSIAWAECEAIFLSSDSMTHPLAAPTTVALPTLASQPSLHTEGSCAINGTTIPGAMEGAIDLAAQVMVGIDGSPGDGLLYPTVAAYLGGSPKIEVGHADPIALLATLGLTGVAAATNFDFWLRDYDSVNHVALTTGVRFRIASGRVIPVDFGADSGRVLRGGLRIEGLSSTTTHPIVVSTGTVP